MDEHAPQQHCEGCPFGGPKVGSKGKVDAPIVFVAESPGREEVRKGAPLVGPSGKIFHTFVPEDADVYVLNAMECFPPRHLKDIDTIDSAAYVCRNRLISKIQAHPRKLIVAMGNAAVRSIMHDSNLKITQIRGRLMNSPLAEYGVLPVVHVAALMRGTGSYRQWREDIEYAMDLANGGSPKIHIRAQTTIMPEETTAMDVARLFGRMLDPKKNPGKELSADIETCGFDQYNDPILMLGITPKGDFENSYCFLPHHFPLLKGYLEREDIKWCWHNGKFDVQFFQQQHGINARVDDDTMLMSYALDENSGVHDLETVAADVLEAPDYKDMLKPWLPNKKTPYSAVPTEVLADYQGIDTSNTAQIREIYRRRVARDPALEKLYTRTLIPASKFLAWVESNGFHVDRERLEENATLYQGQLEEIGQEINDLVGYSINPGSPKQVQELLFRRLRMPDRSKGSTAEDVLLRLQKDTKHPIIDLLLKHRKAVKMYGTYVKGVEKNINPKTGRVHATYLIHGTRTGRLSSRNPNMQNVPRLASIRGTFVAAPGCELVEVDLSQAEIRSLAALSGDPLLVDLYRRGEDLHSDLARYLFPGWDDHPKELKKEERVKCKNVNFGIIYGITEFGLKEQIGGSLVESRRMIRGWYERYVTAGKFIERCRMTPVNNQIITTCFGRKKRVGLVARDNLPFLMNEAANFPHQSIASDITLHAAMRIYEELMRVGIKIVNLVHDSIIMEVPKVEGDRLRLFAIETAANALRQVPIDWGITQVPFKADAEFGHRWGELKEYEGNVYEATREDNP